MENYVLLENIRSAYNVGNIIRTADALGRGVIISGYTPSPNEQPKVLKTSLGAEQHIPIIDFPNEEKMNFQPALDRVKKNNLTTISAEITDTSISLDSFSTHCRDGSINRPNDNICLILGNEISGVEPSTISQSDYVVHIPMLGTKDSLNVGQAAAIMMRELRKK